MTKRYKVMLVKVEQADSSISMEDDYIPIGVLTAGSDQHVVVLTPDEEAVKLTNETKLVSEPEEGSPHAE